MKCLDLTQCCLKEEVWVHTTGCQDAGSWLWKLFRAGPGQRMLSWRPSDMNTCPEVALAMPGHHHAVEVDGVSQALA